MWGSVGVISESILNLFIDHVHKTQKYDRLYIFWVLQLTSTNWWAILEGKYKDLCPVSPLIDHFWQVISASSTTEAASWWFFTPKKWISSLRRGTPWLCQHFFLLKYVATHSRKLHRSYGDICINPLGDMDDFVNIPGKIWHSLRPLYVFLGKN